MSRLTGGELLVETLRVQGVKHVFSIIGGQMCSVYDAITRCPQIQLITVRNESAAPVMAAGSVATTGVPAVSMCTVGAGVVYEVAGLPLAWYQYLPVISIAPQVQSWKMKPHQENLQACNQDGIFEPITKWNANIYHWERIPRLVNRAFREALSNAPGPVHLDIPVDILFKTGKFNDKVRNRIMPPAANTRCSNTLPGSEHGLNKAREALSRGKRPVVIVGQGMGRTGRYPDIMESLKELSLPVLLTDASSGILDGADLNYAGTLRLFAGSARGMELLREADQLLLLGLDDQVADLLASLGENLPHIVQAEVDPGALLAGTRNFVGVQADPGSFIAEVKEATAVGTAPDWIARVQATGEAIRENLSAGSPRMAGIFKKISSVIGNDDSVVVDGPETVNAACAFLLRAKYWDFYIMNTRDMSGTGLPFAIGACLGTPGGRVTLVTDRDSLMRQVQELQTASILGLDISIICVDPGEGEKLARTRSILEGLGCETGMLEPGVAAPARTGRPMAWLCA